jgi:hypothetical protein
MIYSVFDAAKNFGWADISAREIIFYGFIPALIYEAYLQKKEAHKTDYLPFARRDFAINLCITSGLITNESVVMLLSSFITGKKDSVPLPLHELMNTGNDGKLQWIPFHMMPALMSFSEFMKPELKIILQKIVSLFDNFVNAAHSSGKSWESLFFIVLLIRLASRQFDPLFLPFEMLAEYSISINTNLTTAGIAFETIEDVSILVKCINKPLHYPHVAIFFPSNAKFEKEDIIVCVDKSPQHRILFGYQLKEGKDIPKDPLLDDVITHSFLVRGQPAKKEMDENFQNWIIPSEEQIKSFFGESGKHWTPSAWKKMLEKKNF